MPQFGRVPMQRLSEQDMERLLLIAQQEDLQDFCIFGMAYEGFMRVSEVLSLRAGDILPDGRVIVHRVKGSQTNVLPIRNHEVLKVVRFLLTQRPNKSDKLFNRPRRTLDWRMKRYAEKCGIAPERAHMHAIKHGACQDALEETGNNILAVNKLAGHRSLDSTIRYTDMTTDEALAMRDKRG
jgi:integrase